MIFILSLLDLVLNLITVVIDFLFVQVDRKNIILLFVKQAFFKKICLKINFFKGKRSNFADILCLQRFFIFVEVI